MVCFLQYMLVATSCNYVNRECFEVYADLLPSSFVWQLEIFSKLNISRNVYNVCFFWQTNTFPVEDKLTTYKTIFHTYYVERYTSQKMILGYFSIHSAVRDKCNVCDDFLQYHILFMDFHILEQLGYYQYNVK